MCRVQQILYNQEGYSKKYAKLRDGILSLEKLSILVCHPQSIISWTSHRVIQSAINYCLESRMHEILWDIRGLAATWAVLYAQRNMAFYSTSTIRLILHNDGFLHGIINRDGNWFLHVYLRQRREQVVSESLRTSIREVKPNLHPKKTMIFNLVELENFTHREILEKNRQGRRQGSVYRPVA